MGFRAMTELASNSEPKARERLWDTALSAIRQMSVSIRKLCLDGQGASLRRAVGNPTMHPLGGAKGPYRKVTLTWKVPPIEGQLSFEDGRQEQLTIPEREFQIQLGRLYGIVFLDDDACAIHSPFDYSAPSIALDAWLNLKALQVNSVAYTISDVLRLVANAEGAHSPDFLPALIGGGFNPEQVGNGTEMKHRLANAVRFGLFLVSASYRVVHRSPPNRPSPRAPQAPRATFIECSHPSRRTRAKTASGRSSNGLFRKAPNSEERSRSDRLRRVRPYRRTRLAPNSISNLVRFK